MATIRDAYPGTSIPQNNTLKQIQMARQNAKVVTVNPKNMAALKGTIENDVIPCMA